MNNFQIILTSIFAFFIIVGAVLFATYRSEKDQFKDVNVTIWGTISTDAFDNFSEILKNQKNKELTFEYTEIDSASFDRTLVEALASDTGPDLILLPQDMIMRFKDKVYPIPYASFDERTYKDTFIEESELYLTSDGILGVPFFVDPLVMYWNRSILNSASIAKPPSKWSELPAFAQKISKSDVNANITRSAISFGEFRNVSNAKALISTLILQTKNPIVGYDEKGILVSLLDSVKDETTGLNTAESALRFYSDYSNPKKPVYSWNRAMPDSKTAFLSEDLALYFGFSSEYFDIKAKNPNLNFDISVVPQIGDDRAKATFGNMQAFAIMKSSPNIGAAYNLLSYLISREAVEVWTSVYSASPARRDIIFDGSENAIVSTIYSSALISKAWLEPEKDSMETIFRDMVEDITTGRSKIEDAVSDASQKINSMIK